MKMVVFSTTELLPPQLLLGQSPNTNQQQRTVPEERRGREVLRWQQVSSVSAGRTAPVEPAPLLSPVQLCS